MTGGQEDGYWPLSGKPFFDLILSKSHLYPRYNLFIPAGMQLLLPSQNTRVVLTYKDKTWDVMLYGKGKRFDSSWRHFVDDNHLKAGDACVFELMECLSTKVTFKVQILRGDLPAELLANISGETAAAPIVIE
ncbi:B3 domain-containing protein Os04g0386900-like [Rhodamnia argentea]|uniref:B3 domain-containing protein Os04g0386900-like n=1 Tax=Rhodamnia argentea TaxID=178133 RepID=A0A8B8R0W4_9MYRT|nr:B3 domain-containing protein Os04g0386900-like [Rhodamnia argentea]